MKMKTLSQYLGSQKLPDYLINYIEHFSPDVDKLIVIHEPIDISGYKDQTTNQRAITRSKGFIGKREREVNKFPNAIHHIFVLYNSFGKARIFYKYQGNIRFLKTIDR
jgi:hypothetical protein